MTLSDQCKATLYSLVFEARSQQQIVFIQAVSRVAAIRRAMDALVCLLDIGVSDMTLTHIACYAELLQYGHSDVESFRIFEGGWRGGTPDDWATSPLFLSNDASLLGTWAAFRLDLASEETETALRRARF